MAIIEFMTKNAVLSIIIISLIVSLTTSVFMKIFTDQERIKELKKRQKELNLKIRELQKKNEFSKIEELNKEVLDVSMQLMKSSFSGKQFLFTTIPLLFLFSWLRTTYVPILGNSWLWIYLASTLVSNIIIRKVLKMA